jgi:phenylpropionate dioxygenase-like ring-hydroxylating dioxygenase large terminal subunit
MSKETLLEMARDNMSHASAGTIRQAAAIEQVPVANYIDEKRWQHECQQVFHRLPLLLATSTELSQTGDYKALSVMDLPVLICRNESGEIKAFENSCAHRGSQVVAEGRGNSKRFTCPYHAWSYDHSGTLKHVLNESEFGEVDRSCNRLTELPCLEVAGLIWVVLDSRSSLDISAYLCQYQETLAQFDFANWHFFADRTLRGPNWKIAYDGYLDFYHLPVLHKNTFGTDISNQALYYQWGPHQRVTSPKTMQAMLQDLPESDWPDQALLSGVWTIFPHVSIASFAGVGAVAEDAYEGIMLSQLFPGKEPGESFTVQNFLVDRELTPEQIEAATAQFSFLEGVVRDEDYATGLKQQKALAAGSREFVLFGRNEEGGQRFHGWVETILKTPDDELAGLFGAR